MKWLSGKKTYIGMILLGIMYLVQSFGIEIPAYAFAAVGTLTGVALRHAVKKAER